MSPRSAASTPKWPQLKDAEYDLDQTTVVAPADGYTTGVTLAPGQPAELVLQLYPGKTLKAEVDSLVLMSQTGQLEPSGEVPEQPSDQRPPGQYAVILKISDAAELPLGVPGGAIGTAAIYTESAKATQIIRKVMVRMQAWKNYIIPG